MCILPVGGSSESSSPMKNCLENTRLQAIMLLVGGILVGSGIALICLAQPGTPMGVIGGVVISVGLPFLTYGLFLLIYNQCVLKRQRPNPTNEPDKNEDKKSLWSRRPNFLKGGAKLSSTSMTNKELPEECRMDFSGKMEAIYPNFNSVEKTTLKKRAEELTISDLSDKTAIRGADKDNREFLAVKRDKNTLWVFAQMHAGNIGTNLYTIKGSSVKTSSPFTNKKELEGIKTALN